MAVKIQISRPKPRRDSPRSRSRKTAERAKTQRTAGNRDGAPARKTERLFFCLFLALPLVTLIQTVLARTTGYMAARQAPQETVLLGPRWAYVVPFAVSNKADIEKLIQCESGGMNISRPDSDGITSDGILQFHRGPNDTLYRSTWEDFSKASGLTGSPRNPVDAIRMTDWAISHDLGYRWTCWRREGLSPGS